MCLGQCQLLVSFTCLLCLGVALTWMLDLIHTQSVIIASQTLLHFLLFAQNATGTLTNAASSAATDSTRAGTATMRVHAAVHTRITLRSCNMHLKLGRMRHSELELTLDMIAKRASRKVTFLDLHQSCCPAHSAAGANNNHSLLCLLAPA